MNAAASDKLARIRKLSRVGNVGVTALLALGLVSTPIILGAIAFGPTYEGFKVSSFGKGVLVVPGNEITTLGQKLVLIAAVALVMAITIKGLFHLRGLFRNFSVGAIYTRANVHHIRMLGWLAMAGAGFGLLAPALAYLLVQAGVFDAHLLAGSALDVTPISFGPFVTAGLILLASWIMDVGRETSDDAEALRKDAELVV